MNKVFLGTVNGISRSEARKTVGHGTTYASLSDMSVPGRELGSYWISPRGIWKFAVPGHSFYLENKDGTFRKASEKEFESADWSARLFITERAIRKALEGKGPLFLHIGNEFDVHRLVVYSGRVGYRAQVPYVQEDKEFIKDAYSVRKLLESFDGSKAYRAEVLRAVLRDLR
jgi:hypothetical protein